MVWVLTWEKPSDCEHHITVWDSEQAALSQACSEIQDAISSDWDMDLYDCAVQAKSINDAICNGDLRAAMRLYNEWESDSDYGCFFNVSQKQSLSTNDAATPEVFDEDFFTALLPDDDGSDEDEEENEEKVDNTPYQATSPGATCRGPCGSYNDMAYADQRNGTYCCYQCRTFSHIFGAKS